MVNAGNATWWKNSGIDPEMASIPLEPPTPFNIKTQITGSNGRNDLNTTAKHRDSPTLLYCMEEEANDILMSTKISAENQKKYAKVMKKVYDLQSLNKHYYWRECNSIGGVNSLVRL